MVKNNVFGRHMVILRERRAMTVERLASRCNLAAFAVRAYEAGQKLPSHETLLCIADALDTDLDFLCGRSPTASDRVVVDITELPATSRQLVIDLVTLTKGRL